MELQKQIISEIFSRINAYPTTRTKDNQILSELKVSLTKFDVDTHLLILTSKCLYLQKIHLNHSKNKENQIYSVNIDFQLNFQFQSAVQNDINSKKIGISFLKGSNNIIRLYSLDQADIFNMRNQLIRFINERRFHEQYIPYDKLGKGSFAIVYAVFNTQTREKFAVKAISKSNIYRIQSGKQALINQLQIMRTVSHSSKNLLSLYGIYETQNSIYPVQTLLQGKSLQYLISRERTAGFSYDQTRYIMLGILNAVKALHRMKIMHRDLKPENVIFKKQTMRSPQQYDPVIVDYGMCQNYQKINYIFFRCGTPGYVAPEIGRLQNNTPYSPACDMFSVGCLFHLIMTGCSIFDSQTHQETLKKNLLLEFTIKKNRVKKKHPLAMNFLSRLLEPIPSMRITAQQALQNDFFGDLKVMRTIPQKKIGVQTKKIEQEQIFLMLDKNQKIQVIEQKQIQQVWSSKKKPEKQIVNVSSSRSVSPQHQIIKYLQPQSSENIQTRESIKSQNLTSKKSTELLIQVSPKKKQFAF